MSSLVEPGFAIRRMSRCLTGIEVDCGTTGNDGFHGCCPSSLVCDPKAPNRICCPPGDDSCTEKALAAKPQPPCANGTWDLFENGGYYCCEHGVQAYNRSNTNWCGKPSRLVSVEVVTLSLLREGVDPATMASTTSTPLSSIPTSSSALPGPSFPALTSASADSPSASPSPHSEQTSSPPVGAIVGGVVGGVVALSLIIFLTWFYLRKRRQTHTPELHDNSYTAHEKYASTSTSGGPVYEVGEHEHRTPVAEMAGNTRLVELDGMGTVR